MPFSPMYKRVAFALMIFAVLLSWGVLLHVATDARPSIATAAAE